MEPRTLRHVGPGPEIAALEGRFTPEAEQVLLTSDHEERGDMRKRAVRMILTAVTVVALLMGVPGAIATSSSGYPTCPASNRERRRLRE